MNDDGGDDGKEGWRGVDCSQLKIIFQFCYSLASLFLRTLNSDVGVIDLSYLLVLKVWFWRVENQHVDFFTLVYRTDRLIDWLSSLTRLSAAKYYLI